jgi:hypothetical protein
MKPIAAATIAIALALPAGALAQTPIPQEPGAADGVPSFSGRTAIPNPVSSPDPPRHPFMAPNARSNIHVDAFQTDANQGMGPLGNEMRVKSTFQSADCASVTFDSKDRIVTVCVGLEGPRLMMFDAQTLRTLAQFPLPPRLPSDPSGVFNDFAGGGYFYLDHQDRAVMPTTTRHIWVVGQTDGPGFRLERDHDVTSAVPPGDKIISALPDWSGRIWFASTKGVVGTIDPASGAVRSTDLKEDNANSFAVDDEGAAYIVTKTALYRFDAGSAGQPVVTWREVYPNSGISKPGQVNAGSGTTPTVMADGLIAIADNADPMNIVVYKKAKSVSGPREVCRQPVFGKGASATDNSLIAAGRSLVVENNYGYSGPAATMDGKVTKPGLARVDLDADGSGCRQVWESKEISPTVVPKLSLANGLVYAYTKNTHEDDPWFLTALDFRTGRTVWKKLAGAGLGFNNNYAPVTLGPDGSAYVGVLGGLVLLQDKVPPHAGGSRGRRPSLRFRIRRVRGKRLLATLAGRDRGEVRRVDFIVGRRHVARDDRGPFRRTVRTRPFTRKRVYRIRASVRLKDGRLFSYRKKFRRAKRR